ncbi:MAG: ABC transporter substrate-binding protein [Deltaproteobacteria bacterium]|jgi:branched-chain amino acid transport system substrate-binding protein|nr:ABC transporter substrate-binding protein [Deltaproteobacteria bacterium]
MKKAVLSGLLFAFCLFFGLAVSASAQETLKIGVVSPVSGNYGDHGVLERAGMEMALKELGGTILGRPVELVVADSETNPDTAARRVRGLIERDGIKIFMGGVNSSVGMAVGAVAQERGALYIATNANSDELTSTRAVRNMFRVAPNMASLGRAAGTYAINNLGKKWFFMTHDYSWGHSGTRWARDVLTKNGGTEVGEVKFPMGTRDFSAQLLQVRDSDADVLMITCAGFDNVALLKQLAEYRIHDKMQVVYTLQDFVDGYPLPADEHRGYYAAEIYWDENPKMKAASEKFHEMFPDAILPVLDSTNYNGYVALKAVARAIEKAGSADDVDKIILALEGMEIEDNLRDTPTYVDPRTHQFLSKVVMVEADPTGSGVNIWKLLETYDAKVFDMTLEENPVDLTKEPLP